jgi:enoyl-CoA hydratase
VVSHEELLPTSRQIAATIAGNDQALVEQVLEGYKQVSLRSVGDALQVEEEFFWKWHSGGAVTPESVEERRAAIRERGRKQL